MNQQLYESALQAVEDLKQTCLEQARLVQEFTEAEYDLTVAQARVERAIIEKAGGDEKRLGLTAETRAKAYALALDADENYKEKRIAHIQIKARLEEAKIISRSKYGRLDVMLAALKAQDIKIEVPQEPGAGIAPAVSAAA
jgi:DnaJ-domain-containing protein 1